jgi:hypothetical protein
MMLGNGGVCCDTLMREKLGLCGKLSSLLLLLALQLLYWYYVFQLFRLAVIAYI